MSIKFGLEYEAVSSNKCNSMQIIKNPFHMAIKAILSFMLVLLSLLISTTGIAQLMAAEALRPEQSSSVVTHWSEVDLVYYKDFPYTEYKHYQPVSGCSLIHRQIKGRPSTASYLLHCVEQIQLLLPTVKAETLREAQQMKGYLDPGADDTLMAGHAFHGIHAYITLIKPVSLHADLLHSAKNKQLVSVLFIRHALNVKVYQFKNMITGSISTIKATDNHPFYLENKKAFVPIGCVSSSDRLITATGQAVKLVCPENGKKHCGTPYKNNKPVVVFNMEVNQKHTYFVGNNSHILVHNCEGKVKDAITNAHIDKTQAVRLGFYKKGRDLTFESAYYDLNSIRELFFRENFRVYWYGCTDISALTSPYSRKKVDMIENFFHEQRKPLDIMLLKLNSRGEFTDITSFYDPVFSGLEKDLRGHFRWQFSAKFRGSLVRVNAHIRKAEYDLYDPSGLHYAASAHEKESLTGTLNDYRKEKERLTAWMNSLKLEGSMRCLL